MRFPQEVADALQRIARRDWDHETLRARLDDMGDVKRFVEKDLKN